MSEANLILLAGGLLAAGVAPSRLAGRVRLPALVLLLVLGMAAGSDGVGGVPFADYDTARLIGVAARPPTLFEGGLATGWRELGPVIRPSLGLAVAGTAVTAIVTGAVAAVLFDLSALEGLLLGSILASTGGAPSCALVQGSSLRRRLALTLEGEAGFNDPVAVFLVTGFVEWLQHPGFGVADLGLLFVREMGLGTAAGLGVRG